MGGGYSFICVFWENIRDSKFLPVLLAGGGLKAVDRFPRVLELDLGLIGWILKSVDLAPHTLPLSYGLIHISGLPGIHYAADVALEPLVLLPLLPECWDCRCVPPCLICVVLEE